MPRFRVMEEADASGRQGLGAADKAGAARALLPHLDVRVLPQGRIGAFRDGRLLVSADDAIRLAQLVSGL